MSISMYIDLYYRELKTCLLKDYISTDVILHKCVIKRNYKSNLNETRRTEYLR